MQNLNVLFVCTGNIFRSVTAEYCLKKFIKDNNIDNWEVFSTGTIGEGQLRYVFFHKKMEEMGMGEVSKHQSKKLSEEDLEKSDFVIAMARYHKDFIEKNFNYRNVYLFTELVGDGVDDVYDIGEIEGDTRTQEEVIEDTIAYICNKTPEIFKVLSELEAKREV